MILDKLKSNLGAIGAIATWAIIFSIFLYWLPNSPEHVQNNTIWIILLFCLYILCFAKLVYRNETLPIDYKFYGIFLTQLLSAFALMLMLPLSFLSILTIIWSAVLPHVTTLKRSILITAAVITIWFVVYHFRWNDNGIIFTALLYSTFHFFAILMNFETVQAEKANIETQRLNKELQTTQSLLAESNRQNERTRIARDLHDLLGHHLTALSINLQVAERLSEGEAKEKIKQCHVLSKLLLSDVREAVSTLRNNQQLDLDALIAQLSESLPNFKVHRSVDVSFNLEQLDIARSILSSIQEAITNTLKHSKAKEFWVEVKSEGDAIVVNMWDNGHCSSNLSLGNGLSGMRERMALLNGSASFDNSEGFLRYVLQIPKFPHKDNEMLSGNPV